MRRPRSILGQLVTTLILASLLAGGVGAALAASKSAPLISKEELRPRLGSQELVLIDVRSGKDWKASQKKIKAALREDPDQVAVWAKKYKPKQDIVLYCA